MEFRILTNKLAEHKLLPEFLTISVSRIQNLYVEEIFEIAGWKFADEEYVFDTMMTRLSLEV